MGQLRECVGVCFKSFVSITIRLKWQSWTREERFVQAFFGLSAHLVGGKTVRIVLKGRVSGSHFREDLSLALTRVGGIRSSNSSSVLDDDDVAADRLPRRPGDGDILLAVSTVTASPIATSLLLLLLMWWPLVAATQTFLAEGSTKVWGEVEDRERLRFILLK